MVVGKQQRRKNMVIIIQMSQQPDALDLEVWKMKPKPQPIDPELAPELASGDPILRQYNPRRCAPSAHPT